MTTTPDTPLRLMIVAVRSAQEAADVLRDAGFDVDVQITQNDGRGSSGTLFFVSKSKK